MIAHRLDHDPLPVELARELGVSLNTFLIEQYASNLNAPFGLAFIRPPLRRNGSISAIPMRSYAYRTAMAISRLAASPKSLLICPLADIPRAMLCSLSTASACSSLWARARMPTTD